MKHKVFFVALALAVVGVTGAGSIYASSHREEMAQLTHKALQTVGVRADSDLDSEEELADVSDTNSKVEMRESNSGTGREEEEIEDEAEEEDEREGDDDDEGSASFSGQGAAQASGQTTTPASTAPTASTATFTLAQVAAHNTKTDCYTAIEGVVYNLTPFIASHPGGVSAISSLCGIDGTAGFYAQHGGQGKPAQELASLKIGTLVQ